MPVTTKANLNIYDSTEAAAGSCSAYILDELSQALKSRGTATLAISGGTTPRLLYADLANAPFHWSNVHVFWVDERCVPPTDPQSNYRLAAEVWFRPANFPATNIHRIFGELNPSDGSSKYSSDIEDFFHITGDEIPEFDVIHRGMGADSHTASLFPGEPLIKDLSHIATHLWVEKLQMHRITLLPAVLLKGRKTVLQVSGSDKADALRAVLEGAENWMEHPCQIASRDSNASWFIDRAAAAKL